LLSHTAKYEAVPFKKSGIFTSEPSFIYRKVDRVILKASEMLQMLHLIRNAAPSCTKV